MVIRLLESGAEFRQCVALQREVWGDSFEGIVPASLMLAATHIDAVTVGAFEGPDRLVGFVFGLTGRRDGEVVHWSHMLGVLASARNQGLGLKLKEYQRAELARRGIRRMYWTFDPLQSRNAHLNLNRLGARVIDYVVDMYGSTRSPLHHGLTTDRLIVECDTEQRSPPEASASLDLPILSAFPRAGDDTPNGTAPGALAIEIPWDVQEVVATAPAQAQAWRQAVREQFDWAFKNGYVVTRALRDAAARRSFYRMDRRDAW